MARTTVSRYNSHSKSHGSSPKDGAGDASLRTQPTKAPESDVLVEGGGSLYVFRILSESARAWVEENVSQEGFQPQFPNVLYVEHRYVEDLATGMLDAGLAVR